MNKLTVEQFRERVNELVAKHSQFRYGQAVWNLGSSFFKLTYDSERFEDCDPFYSDSKVEAFIERLVEVGYLKR